MSVVTTFKKSEQLIDRATYDNVKARAKAVGLQKVQKKLGFTQQNLNYHLNKKDLATVNLETLERILKAVEAIEAENKKRAEKLRNAAQLPTTL